MSLHTGHPASHVPRGALRVACAVVVLTLVASGVVVGAPANSAQPALGIDSTAPALTTDWCPPPYPVPYTSVYYAINFTETGLPTGTIWGLQILNSSWNFQIDVYSDNGTICLPNGTDYYSGFTFGNQTYQGTNNEGTLTIQGANFSVPMSFVPTFPLVFNETGGPPGGAWSVTLDGFTHSSQNTTVSFLRPNGTAYSYVVMPPPGYVSSPPSGNVSVAGKGSTSNLQFSVDTTDPRYLLDFNESGLPPNTSWSVSIETWTNVSENRSIGFSLPNGSGYPFEVTSPIGYVASPSSGQLGISGAGITQPVSFRSDLPPPVFPLWFNETGLPGSVPWGVTAVNGSDGQNLTPSHVANTSVEYDVVAGVRGNYTLQVPSGYRADRTSGSFAMPTPGAPTTVWIAFSAVPFPPPPPVIVSFTATPDSVRVGNSFEITTEVSGAGGGPLEFSYSGLPPPCASQNVSALACVPEQVGAFHIEVTVTDAQGESSGAHVTVTVTPSSTGGTSSNHGVLGSGLATEDGYLLAGLGVAIALVFAIAWWRRRRPPAATVES
ncbi:MAG: hypothetical protein L3K01_02020 [Thermoplasmata archaeon]|nr:hypothetical protein [Thermoplasmata archaeon]